jgi:hypothetical protein
MRFPATDPGRWRREFGDTCRGMNWMGCAWDLRGTPGSPCGAGSRVYMGTGRRVLSRWRRLIPRLGIWWPPSGTDADGRSTSDFRPPSAGGCILGSACPRRRYGSGARSPPAVVRPNPGGGPDRPKGGRARTTGTASDVLRGPRKEFGPAGYLRCCLAICRAVMDPRNRPRGSDPPLPERHPQELSHPRGCCGRR